MPAAQEILLSEIESLLSKSFKGAIVWEQKDGDLVGKYVYIKYGGRELGIFVGCQVHGSDNIRRGITFFFTHPSAAREESKDLGRLFHKLLIRLNLRLRSNPYRFVAGKSPAIMRIKTFPDPNTSAEMCKTFFVESINSIKDCEPLYKTAHV